MKEFLLFANALFLKLASILTATFILSGCSSFFYYPSTLKFYNPEKVQLKEEDVFFKSTENDSIHAWWFAAKTKQVKGTIVFFHGNAENMTTHFLMLHWIPAEGYNYLIFDYPGYGVSSGKPSQKGNVAAGIAAVEWVHKNRDPGPLIIYGQSLGGNVAMRTSELVKPTIPIRNIIIESSFLSYKSMANMALRRSWITWLLSPLAYVLISNSGGPDDISQFSPIPILFIHGEADRTVESVNSEKMFAIAKDPKQIWLIPGGHHGDTYFLEKGKYRELLLNYLDQTAKK